MNEETVTCPECGQDVEVTFQDTLIIHGEPVCEGSRRRA